MSRQWLTVKEAAEKHGLAEITIRKRIERNNLTTAIQEREITFKANLLVVDAEELAADIKNDRRTK